MLHHVDSSFPDIRVGQVKTNMTQPQLLAGMHRKEGLEDQTFKNPKPALMSMKHSAAQRLAITDLYIPDITAWKSPEARINEQLGGSTRWHQVTLRSEVGILEIKHDL